MKEILQIVKEFKKRVSNKLGKGEVLLFGSHAKAEALRESDIDVFVILDRNVDIKVKEAVYDIAYELGIEYGVVLDISVYSRAEWNRYRGVLPFVTNVEKEGIIV